MLQKRVQSLAWDNEVNTFYFSLIVAPPYLSSSFLPNRLGVNSNFSSLQDSLLQGTIMARAFCIPGILFLVAAFVLSFLTSISLPFLSALDITRTHFGTGVIQSGEQGMTELRVSLFMPFRSMEIR
jgi:hypothetical protein